MDATNLKIISDGVRTSVVDVATGREMSNVRSVVFCADVASKPSIELELDEASLELFMQGQHEGEPLLTKLAVAKWIMRQAIKNDDRNDRYFADQLVRELGVDPKDLVET